MNQLQIAPFLEHLGWNEDDIKLAQTHIISRAVYPASELETTRWIKENSSVRFSINYRKKVFTADGVKLSAL